LDIYWNILTMHGPINVKSPNNISKWEMGFMSAFKGLRLRNAVNTLMNYGISTELNNDLQFFPRVKQIQRILLGWYCGSLVIIHILSAIGEEQRR
jgi:hypothetical protein